MRWGEGAGGDEGERSGEGRDEREETGGWDEREDGMGK